MTVNKTRVVDYNLSDTGNIGDIQYWDGNNWVRLNPSDDGKRLITHGVGSPPSWEYVIYNGAVVWYTPGGSWHIGPYIGKIWYQTTTYAGTDPALAAADTWESVSPSYDPIPSIVYNAGPETFAVSGAGESTANTTYEKKGESSGVATYGNQAWVNGNPI